MSELTVQIEELSPVVRRLQIDVPADRVSRVTDTVYQRLGRTVKLPGYRPGHVPRRVLEKHFSDQVRSEVVREVMKTTFSEALGSTKLAPVSEPTVEPEKLTLGEAFHYAARVEIRPEVELAQYKGLEITVPDRAVAESAVDERLEAIRERQATLDPVEGRDEAATGDYASVSYELAIDGEKAPERKREGGIVEIRPGAFLDGYGEALAGMKVGETREITETFTPEQDPSHAGRAAHIRVTLEAIKKRRLPDLDDEFAKDVRGLETLAALKAAVREELETAAQREQDNARREAVVDALIEKNPIEVPPALVDNSAAQIATEFAYRLIQSGLKLDDMAIVERLKQDAMPRATREVKAHFLLDAVAKAENIEIKPEDIDQRISELAAEEGLPLAKIAARYAKPEARAALSLRMRNQRATDVLLASANVTTRPPQDEAAKQPEEAPEKKAEDGGAAG